MWTIVFCNVKVAKFKYKSKPRWGLEKPVPFTVYKEDEKARTDKNTIHKDKNCVTNGDIYAPYCAQKSHVLDVYARLWDKKSKGVEYYRQIGNRHEYIFHRENVP